MLIPRTYGVQHASNMEYQGMGLGWGIGWMAADALPLLLPFSRRSSTGQWPLVISTVLYHNAHYGVHTAPYICTHACTHVHAQTQTHAHTHVCVYILWSARKRIAQRLTRQRKQRNTSRDISPVNKHTCIHTYHRYRHVPVLRIYPRLRKVCRVLAGEGGGGGGGPLGY